MVTGPFTLRYMLTTQPDYPEVYEVQLSRREHGGRARAAQ